MFKATKVDTGEIVAIKKVLQDKRFKVVPRGALFSSTTAQCHPIIAQSVEVSREEDRVRPASGIVFLAAGRLSGKADPGQDIGDGGMHHHTNIL